MKLLSHSMDRKGDKITVSGRWHDRFRRPVRVRVLVEEIPEGADPGAFLTGDVKDVDGIVQGIAEMAWAGGWRPRGLDAALAHVVRMFKIPTNPKR